MRASQLVWRSVGKGAGGEVWERVWDECGEVCRGVGKCMGRVWSSDDSSTQKVGGHFGAKID